MLTELDRGGDLSPAGKVIAPCKAEKPAKRFAMTRVTVIATLRSFPENAPAVRAELLRLLVPTRSEAGCINYDLLEDPEDPAIFIFHENWESGADLDRHLESDHIKACLSAIDGLLESADVRRMRALDIH